LPSTPAGSDIPAPVRPELVEGRTPRLNPGDGILRRYCCCSSSVRPELVEGRAPFDRLRANGCGERKLASPLQPQLSDIPLSYTPRLLINPAPRPPIAASARSSLPPSRRLRPMQVRQRTTGFPCAPGIAIRPSTASATGKSRRSANLFPGGGTGWPGPVLQASRQKACPELVEGWAFWQKRCDNKKQSGQRVRVHAARSGSLILFCPISLRPAQMGKGHKSPLT